jgi:hypothetical protein
VRVALRASHRKKYHLQNRGATSAIRLEAMEQIGATFILSSQADRLGTPVNGDARLDGASAVGHAMSDGVRNGGIRPRKRRSMNNGDDTCDGEDHDQMLAAW